jgi:hypothetical protein
VSRCAGVCFIGAVDGQHPSPMQGSACGRCRRGLAAARYVMALAMIANVMIETAIGFMAVSLRIAATLAQLVGSSCDCHHIFNMSSAGIGSAPHVAGELFKMMSGINMVHVPYRGASPSLSDLIGGQVQMTFKPFPLRSGISGRAHCARWRLPPRSVSRHCRPSPL